MTSKLHSWTLHRAILKALECKIKDFSVFAWKLGGCAIYAIEYKKFIAINVRYLSQCGVLQNTIITLRKVSECEKAVCVWLKKEFIITGR